MIFPQYRETFEVLLDYLEIGGRNIKCYFLKAIRNIFHANIDVHSIVLIAEFLGDGVKCIAKLQS